MRKLDPIKKLENKFCRVIQRQAARWEWCGEIVRIGYEADIGNPVYLSRKDFETCVSISPDVCTARVDDNLRALAIALRRHRNIANGVSHRRPYRFTFSPPPSASGVTTPRRLALCAGRFGPGRRVPPIAVVLVEELPPELSRSKAFKAKSVRPRKGRRQTVGPASAWTR